MRVRIPPAAPDLTNDEQTDKVVIMTKYTRSGDIFSVTSDVALDIHDELPVGTYTVVQHPMSGDYMLKMVENVTLPPKLYGDTAENTDRILRTFLDRDASTGVLLAGEKGSGKSLLAKNISVNARDMGISTIIINTSYCGDGFNRFIQSMEQEVIILFDEFEKTYDREKQEALLTLFDGVFPTKKLFILTVNDTYRIDSNITNRPGRMYYNIEFKGLGADFVKEYAEEMLEDKVQVAGLVAVAGLFSSFNFDMLKALVEEMNRYKENAMEAARLLNIKTKDSGELRFEATITLDGVEYLDNNGDPLSFTGNPFTSTALEFYFLYPAQAFEEATEGTINPYTQMESPSVDSPSMADWEHDLLSLPKKTPARKGARGRRRRSARLRTGGSVYERSFEFSTEDLVSHDLESGVLTYENEESGAILTLKRVEERTPRYTPMF